jgi:hypothetical protein
MSKLQSIDQAGIRWTDRRAGANAYSELEGLAPFAIAAYGRMLVLANRRELLEAMLAASSSQPVGPGARYAAAYRHSREFPNFVKMMRLIDNPLNKESSQDAAEPAFFSGNIASIGRTLARVDSESIAVHDTGAIVTQNLVYKLK